MIYFLDTNICIYHLNGSAPNLSRILEQSPPSNIKIASMVAAELIYGAGKSVKREHNLTKVKLFLSLYDIVPFDEKSAEIYGILRGELERAGRVISGNNMIIAATVLSNGGSLVTRNVDEFSRVNGLTVVDWVNEII